MTHTHTLEIVHEIVQYKMKSQYTKTTIIARTYRLKLKILDIKESQSTALKIGSMENLNMICF